MSQESNVTASIELYEHDILRIEQAIKPLQAKRKKAVNLEGFRKEIIERFVEQGFKVGVKVWETNLPGVYAFDLDIVGRVEEGHESFDHERQHHEVVNDLLGIDPSRKGEVIKAPNNQTSPKGFIIKGKE